MSTTAALPMGRETDALIAEKVFGWQWKLDADTDSRGQTGEPYRVICDPRLWGDCPLGGLATGREPARIDRPYAGQQPPKYSSDIASAFTVVQKMRDDGWYCAIVLNGCARGQNGVRFTPGFRMVGRDMFEANAVDGPYAVAETVPLAICRAALLAIEAGR